MIRDNADATRRMVAAEQLIDGGWSIVGSGPDHSIIFRRPLFSGDIVYRCLTYDGYVVPYFPNGKSPMDTIYCLAQLCGAWHCLLCQLRHSNMSGLSDCLSATQKGFDDAKKDLSSAIEDHIESEARNRATVMLTGMGFSVAEIYARLNKG